MKIINLNVPTKKNLLAFSAGVDSSALFHLLLDTNVQFDIAIVDYNQRVQSKDEVIYATQLAHKYAKKCFITTYPKDRKFSENDARNFRYMFFEEIITNENYEALITAHQLDDKLEWFLMQLTKGAGLSELLGFEEVSCRDDYMILKPLLKYTKNELLEYLKLNNLKYFIDDSNMDEKYKRNYFRHNFSNKLLENYSQGIKNSFEYLENDKKSLFSNIELKKIENLHIYTYNKDKNVALRIIDKELKQRGIIISKATRDEISNQKEIIIANQISVSLEESKIWVGPYLNVAMNKKFKEKCRINNIPKNIRPYLSTIKSFTF